MGLFLTGIIALAIIVYVFFIIKKSSKNIKDGKCISCNGHCSVESCSFNEKDKMK